MLSTNVRIDERALVVLRELARSQGQTVQTVLNEAINSYRLFLDETAFAGQAMEDSLQRQ